MLVSGCLTFACISLQNKFSNFNMEVDTNKHKNISKNKVKQSFYNFSTKADNLKVIVDSVS